LQGTALAEHRTEPPAIPPALLLAHRGQVPDSARPPRPFLPFRPFLSRAQAPPRGSALALQLVGEDAGPVREPGALLVPGTLRVGLPLLAAPLVPYDPGVGGTCQRGHAWPSVAPYHRPPVDRRRALLPHFAGGEQDVPGGRAGRAGSGIDLDLGFGRRLALVGAIAAGPATVVVRLLHSRMRQRVAPHGHRRSVRRRPLPLAPLLYPRNFRRGTEELEVRQRNDLAAPLALGPPGPAGPAAGAGVFLALEVAAVIRSS
jgi:hypothetical protein